jgi:hypothetical protein
VPKRLFLHLGPPKTGTTFVQGLLGDNAMALRQQQILVSVNQADHHDAANELLNTTGPRGRRIPIGALDKLGHAITGFHGDAVFSSERYSLLQAPEARRFQEAFATRQLHAVFTVRDPAALLPGRWQERVKNGGVESWGEFCRRVATQRGFLRAMIRIFAPLEAWTEVLPADRIHIVTVPGATADDTLLLERFCRVIGADMRQLTTDDGPRTNRSMDLVGTELVRRLNIEKGSGLSPHTRHSEIKTFLAEEVLAGRSRASKPKVTREAFHAARAESEDLTGMIRAGGYRIIGDLADLTTTKPPSPQDHTPQIASDDLLWAALEGISALANRSYHRRREINRISEHRPGFGVRRRLRRLLVPSPPSDTR